MSDKKTKTSYIRDKRSPVPKNKNVSVVMSANKDKNTGPEMEFRKALRRVGLMGYRLHWKKAPGRPDITYPRKKVAIFINGCYWHRCPYCKYSLPKTNRVFWRKKFETNKDRDKKKKAFLKKEGWKVFVFWECQVKKKSEKLAEKINKYIISL